MWRNGVTQNTARSEISGNVPLMEDIRTPGTSALPQRMQQRPATANGRNDIAGTPRPSLSSLLDGNNSTSSSSDRYKSDGKEQQQQRTLMSQQHVKGGYGEPYGTPGRQLDGSRASSLIPPPAGCGQGQGFAPKLLNAGSSERPLTPSTLFLMKSQQSQYFPRQQQDQQQQQQQQIRQQHQLQQQVRLRCSRLSIPSHLK